MSIYGTAGDDNLAGTEDIDVFGLRQGGNDTANGLGGADTFYMGASLTAADRINGGTGLDKVVLRGDYSAGLVLGGNTLKGIEVLRLGGNSDYDLTMRDGNVAAGQTLIVNAAMVGGHHLTFDGSAEKDGHFSIFGTDVADALTGGGEDDRFYLASGGADTVHGRGGNDRVDAGNLTASHTIDGGSGDDLLTVTGLVGADNLICTATTITNVETLLAVSDISMGIIMHDANVAAGATMTVDMSIIGPGRSFTFGGGNETDGHFAIIGGGGAGAASGGALDDTFTMNAHTGAMFVTGNGGADDITCNTGTEQINFGAVSHSTSTTHDVVHNLDLDADRFGGTGVVTLIEAPRSGTLASADFDVGLFTIIGANLAADHALTVTATGGDLAGHVYLVVDGNNVVGYQAGGDFVIDITGFTGTLDTTDFS